MIKWLIIIAIIIAIFWRVIIACCLSCRRQKVTEIKKPVEPFVSVARSCRSVVQLRKKTMDGIVLENNRYGISYALHNSGVGSVAQSVYCFGNASGVGDVPRSAGHCVGNASPYNVSTKDDEYVPLNRGDGEYGECCYGWADGAGGE
jgi:hypothetical protein